MRRILGWAVALLSAGSLAVTVVWLLHLQYERGRFAPCGSSYRSDADGARALFLLLEETGHRPRRSTSPAPPPGGLLVSLEPGPCHKEANRKLLDWIQEGGILVLAGSARSERIPPTAPG